jgi:hypothetical protein
MPEPPGRHCGAQIDLPVPQVARARVWRERATITRAQVLEELDAWPIGRAQRGDAQVRAEDIVQPLLLWAPVLARPGHTKSKSVAIEGEARFGMVDYDRGVINAEEQLVGSPVPLRVAFSFRELENLEVVAVRILEVEGLDPAGVRVPVRGGLRFGR